MPRGNRRKGAGGRYAARMADRTGYHLAHAELRAHLRWLAARAAAEEYQPGGVSDETRVEVARGLADACVMLGEVLDRLDEREGPEPSLRVLLRAWVSRRLMQ